MGSAMQPGGVQPPRRPSPALTYLKAKEEENTTVGGTNTHKKQVGAQTTIKQNSSLVPGDGRSNRNPGYHLPSHHDTFRHNPPSQKSSPRACQPGSNSFKNAGSSILFRIRHGGFISFFRVDLRSARPTAVGWSSSGCGSANRSSAAASNQSSNRFGGPAWSGYSSPKRLSAADAFRKSEAGYQVRSWSYPRHCAWYWSFP
ncbi:hypothetical protein VTG60DRAFT_1506 [Thermothelomyces hinnuleus]